MPEGAQLNIVSPLLTQLAMGFIGDQTDYVADRIFAPVLVAAPSGIYPKWERGDFLRKGGKRLANREAPPLVDFATGKGNYSTDHWGVGQNYTAREVAEAATQGMTENDLRELITYNVTSKALIDREVTVAAMVQTAANWSTTYAGVASGPTGSQFVKWDLAGGTPVDDIKRARRVVRLLTGITLNKLVVSEDVKDALLKNAQILALWQPSFVGGSRPTVLNIEQLRDVLELEEIVVAKAVYNQAAEGQADSYANIWSNTAWLGYTNPRPQIRAASAGYTFVWSGDVTAGLPSGARAPASGPQMWGAVKNDKGLWIRTSEIVRPQSRVIDVEKFDQPNVVSPDLGVTFTSPIG